MNDSEADNKQLKTKLVSTHKHKKPYRTKTNKNTLLKLIRSSFQLFSLISPRLTGWWAYRLWLSTHRFAEPEREKQWLKSATQSQLPHQYGPITIYHWPQTEVKDPPQVLLIHGWNGRGLQLAAFVEPLLKAGFAVVSFDAPGHGRTPGKDCNLLRIADVVHSISQSIGPFDSIIGHSFGAMVMAKLANDDLNFRKGVSISSPINADYLIDGFCSVLKIKGKSKDNLLHRVYRHFGDDIFDRISAINNLRELSKKESSILGLVVHDMNDREIPYQHAQALNQAWLGSKLILTEKLGHLRILRNKKVVGDVVDFIVSSD